MLKKIFIILVSCVICCSQQYLLAQSNGGKKDDTEIRAGGQPTKDDLFSNLKKKRKVEKIESQLSHQDTIPTIPIGPVRNGVEPPIEKLQTDTIYVYAADYLDSVSVAYYQRVTKKHGWMKRSI